MNRNERTVLALLVLLFLLGLLFWRFGPGGKPTPENPVLAPSTSTVTSPLSAELHPELIPKNVDLARVSYSKDGVAPGTSLGFDIHGSGFTDDFVNQIQVDTGQQNVRVKNLRRVGSNLIHGDIDVGTDAAAGVVYPRATMKGLPVYVAKEPLSVIRKEDVTATQPPKTHPPHGTTKPTLTPTPTGQPVPPKIELHKELIPKNIEIVRCYYSQDVVPPGTTFGFDINGSGFTSEFEKMIKLESGHLNVLIKNLHLVTANQIHGELDVGIDAKTSFVYPRVLIHNLPVFSATEPFAVVRKSEVLTVFFTSMEENGRGGRFRIITNLDDDLAKTFQIDPSTPGIKISDLKPQLPFVMDGHLQIEPGVPPGEHGLAIFVNGQEKYRRVGMIRIVRPNIGQTGFIQGLTAEEKFHRPGDTIQIYVQATGLSAQDTSGLNAKVQEFDMGKASFTYLSPLQLRLTFNSPQKTPEGSYGVQVLSSGGQVLFDKKDLFKIIPPDWVAGVQVSPPVRAGGKSTLKVLGRDFSDGFASNIHIDVDEPGITIGTLQRADASTLTTEITVGLKVAPGDYWLHLSNGGQKIDPPYGSIIKVQAGL